MFEFIFFIIIIHIYFLFIYLFLWGGTPVIGLCGGTLRDISHFLRGETIAAFLEMEFGKHWLSPLFCLHSRAQESESTIFTKKGL